VKTLTIFSLIEIGRTVDYERKVADLLDPDIQALHEMLRKENANITYILQIVGNWLCNAAHMKIDILTRGTLSSFVNPCDPARVTWLGVVPFSDILSSETAFCLDVGSFITFENMVRIDISMNTENMFLQNRTDEHILNNFIDFTGDPVSSGIRTDYIQFPTHGCLAFEISIEAKMLLLDRTEARCNVSAKSRLACYGGCDVLMYELTDQCKCTQLAWRYLYRDERLMCFDNQSIEEHFDCRRAARRTNIADVCRQGCLFPCAHRMRTIQSVSAGCNRKDHGEERVALELMPKRFTVAIFEEQLSVSVSELFSRLGGTCGLWLGVGILGIFHALLFPLKLLARLVQEVNRANTGTSFVGVELSRKP